MATTTPNYGWDVPTSSDYVKLGAVAIETLGDDIDASLFSITGGKNVGLQYITGASFTGASTISVNNCFTTDYDYYKLILTNDALATSSGNVYIKWRVGGVDSSASYNWGALGVEAGGNQLGNQGNNSSLGFLVAQTRNANGTFGFSMDIQNVRIATPTQVQYIFTSNTPTYSTVEGTFSGGQHSVSTAYDGFSIIAPGNISGKYKVYGYRN
jgi:hypothetical protein